MPQISETRLPGVGVRHDFATRAGRRLGVITHRGGQRELLVYADDDPDACTEIVRLDESETRALAELLGAAQVSASLADIKQEVEGLAIDWVEIGPDWWAGGRTIGESQLRRRTSVSIVAVLRGDHTVPSPAPEEVLHADDTAVVVGTPDAIRKAIDRLQSGT